MYSRDTGRGNSSGGGGGGTPKARPQPLAVPRRLRLRAARREGGFDPRVAVAQRALRATPCEPD